MKKKIVNSLQKLKIKGIWTTLGWEMLFLGTMTCWRGVNISKSTIYTKYSHYESYTITVFYVFELDFIIISVVFRRGNKMMYWLHMRCVFKRTYMNEYIKLSQTAHSSGVWTTKVVCLKWVVPQSLIIYHLYTGHVINIWLLGSPATGIPNDY